MAVIRIARRSSKRKAQLAEFASSTLSSSLRISNDDQYPPGNPRLSTSFHNDHFQQLLKVSHPAPLSSTCSRKHRYLLADSILGPAKILKLILLDISPSEPRSTNTIGYSQTTVRINVTNLFVTMLNQFTIDVPPPLILKVR